MKRQFLMTLVMSMLMGFGSVVYAQGAVSGAGANSGSESLAVGNAGSIGSGNVAYGPDLSRAVGTAVAPALTTTLTETYS